MSGEPAIRIGSGSVARAAVAENGRHPTRRDAEAEARGAQRTASRNAADGDETLSIDGYG